MTSQWVSLKWRYFPCFHIAQKPNLWKKRMPNSFLKLKAKHSYLIALFPPFFWMVLLVPHFLLELSAHQNKQEHPGSVQPPRGEKKADKWPLTSAHGSGKVLLNYSAHYYGCKCLSWHHVKIKGWKRVENKSLSHFFLLSRGVLGHSGDPAYTFHKNSCRSLGQLHMGYMSAALLAVGKPSSALAVPTCC